MATGPLAGVKVLEFSQIVAGPVVGLALSDLGADVVKVEPPGGENRRNTGAVVPNEGKYFQSLNRGKRSLVIDLSRPEGPALVQRIAPHFDVVISNYRVGVTKRLQIDYDTLRRFNPAIIYANVTGFGMHGPNATRAGSDIIAQAYSGLMAGEGKLDEYGTPVPVMSTTIIDRGTGLAAAMGICAALYHRALTGEGQELSTSLLQTALELQSDRVMREPVQDAVIRDPLVAAIREKRAAGARYDELLAVRKAQQRARTAHMIFHGTYHTAAGTLVLGALTRQNRDTIRRILDLNDGTDDPDFESDAPDAAARIEAARAYVQERLLTRTAAEWVEVFLAAGAPASVVNFAEELSDDPQVEAGEMMVGLVHPITGPQLVVGPLVKMSATPTTVSRSSPPLGMHTREVLSEAGLADAEIARLVELGVVCVDG